MSLKLIPDDLLHLEGKMVDVDSHEMMPTKAWVEVIGPIAEDLARSFERHAEDNSKNPNHPHVLDFQGDIAPVGEDLWRRKGPLAPGATKPLRRHDVMEAMGWSAS